MDALSVLANNPSSTPKCIAALRNVVAGSLATEAFISATQWQQNFQHDAIGYTFPSCLETMFGSGVTSAFQMLHQQSGLAPAGNTAALRALMENSVVLTTLPDGSTGNAILSQLKSAGGTPPQDPFRIQNSSLSTWPAISEFFIQFDIKLPANLSSLLDSNYANNAYWLVLADIKTSGYSSSVLGGDYRFTVQVQIPSGGGTIYFKVRGDNFAANITVPDVDNNTIFWTHNSAVSVPVGEWFKLMIYIKRPVSYNDTTSGRSWAGIATYTNGTMNSIQELHDQQGGIQKGVHNLEFGRVLVPTTYTKAVPLDLYWCNWELWDKMPIKLF